MPTPRKQSTPQFVQVPIPLSTPQIEVAPIQKLAYSPEEAGLALGLCRSYVFELINESKLGVVRRGRKLMIPVTEIQAYLQREISFGPRQEASGSEG